MRSQRFAALLTGCLLLSACGNRNGTAGAGDSVASTDSTALPKPAAIAGSVTGMPDRPGPGNVGLPAADASTPVVASPAPGNADGTNTPAETTGSNDSQNVPDPAATGDEPSDDDAMAVIRDYYAAIDGARYPQAWSLWSDNGRASGQTLQQFADGFANTERVSVDVGSPGAMEGAAGSRFIQIPVTIEATGRDGGVQRYSGTYVLRRSVVDGATAEQRAWRIASATMRKETQ